MNCKQPRRLKVAILLLGYLVVGCAVSAVTPTDVKLRIEGQRAMRPLVRAIIYFQFPTADSRQLTAAIAAVCHCQLVFFRPYLGNALIYEVTLPPGENFAAFENALMRKSSQLGIKSVDEDRLMKIQ